MSFTETIITDKKDIEDIENILDRFKNINDTVFNIHREKYKTCPQCNGKSSKTFNVFGEETIVKCSLCKGEGKIIKAKSNFYSPEKVAIKSIIIEKIEMDEEIKYATYYGDKDNDACFLTEKECQKYCNEVNKGHLD